MPIGKICLDTETTGLDCFRDEIIELAIISYNGDILFHHRINPLRRKSWPKAHRLMESTRRTFVTKRLSNTTARKFKEYLTRQILSLAIM